MKKQKTIFIAIAILIGMGLGVLAWIIFGPVLGKGVFYYTTDGISANADLFSLKGTGVGKKIISVSAEEVDIGKYKSPRRSFLSNDKDQMIYLKKTGEIILENMGNDEFIPVRIVFDLFLVNLKNNKETKIEQKIDSSSLVFSPNDNQIAWIKGLDESTYRDIENSGKKRELWISKSNGQKAEILASFEENLILLKRWAGDYIYFQGLWDATKRSLGRINVKTKKIDYIIPEGCDEMLVNCQNIEFSPSGKYFLYEIYKKDNDKEITELYLGDFEKNTFKPILTTDRIGEKIWLNNEDQFFYTDQIIVKKNGDSVIEERLHLVDIKKEAEAILYSGSYLSQFVFDSGGRYLYFLEKQSEGEDFNLTRFDIKKKEAKTIFSDNYNHILLIQ